MDEPGAIIKRNNLHPFRQHGTIERCDFFFYAVENQRRVLPFAHQDDSGDNVVLLVLADDALARHGIDAHLGEIFDQHRSAVAFHHHDVANIFAGAQQADAANKILLLALLDITAAGVGIATPQGGEELLHGNVVGLHPGQVRIDFVLFDRAAEAHHVGHARRHLELPFHSPIFDAAQLARGELIPLDAVTINFANGGRERRQLRLDGWRQIDPLQALLCLLAGEVIVHLIVEGKHDIRQAKLSVGEQAHLVGQTAERDLQWNGDLLLHFLRRVAGEKRNHSHLNVGNIRKGLDGQRLKSHDPAGHKEHGHHDQKQRLMQGERNRLLNHHRQEPPLAMS